MSVTQDELIAKVERAIEAEFNSPGTSPHGWKDEARAAIRVVLEEAAKVAETCKAREGNVGPHGAISLMRNDISAAIRALIPGEGE